MHTAIRRTELLQRFQCTADDATDDASSSSPPYRAYQTMLSRLPFLRNKYTWTPDPELRPTGNLETSLARLYVPKAAAATVKAHAEGGELDLIFYVSTHTVTVHVREGGGYEFQTAWKIWDKTGRPSMGNEKALPLMCIVHSNESTDAVEAFMCMILWSRDRVDPSMFGLSGVETNVVLDTIQYQQDKQPFVDPSFLYDDTHTLNDEFKKSWHIIDVEKDVFSHDEDGVFPPHDVVVWRDCDFSAQVFQVAWRSLSQSEPTKYIDCKMFKNKSDVIFETDYMCVMRTMKGKGGECKSHISASMKGKGGEKSLTSQR
jgi:hypothetical protein